MSEERPAKRQRLWVVVAGGARAAEMDVDVSSNVSQLLDAVHKKFSARLGAVAPDSLLLYSSKDSKEARRDKFQEFLASTSSWCKWTVVCKAIPVNRVEAMN